MTATIRRIEYRYKYSLDNFRITLWLDRRLNRDQRLRLDLQFLKGPVRNSTPDRLGQWIANNIGHLVRVSITSTDDLAETTFYVSRLE